jgi:alkylation response protein AidB-like acyl-CoA dehydrogenase
MTQGDVGRPISAPEAMANLAAQADHADAQRTWPAAAWQVLQEVGALRWAIPEAHGGLGLSPWELLEGYEQLTRGCVTTCFLLTQRDAAVRRILASNNETLRRELLPPLARGERFATVGIAQLTTSRQHTAPAMRARLDDNQLVLDGMMPWVSGAVQADHLVTGGTLADGRQVLTVLPTDLPGVHVQPPLELMAVQGSCTATVECKHVVVGREWLLAGPSERIMAGDGTGGLATSCLALGLAGAAVEFLSSEATARPELQGIAQRLARTRDELWQTLRQQAEAGGSPEAMFRLRARANLCVLRATQAALTASKGAGFVRPHPAQRWARQALFFLVWSCPRPTAEAMLEWLTVGEPGW